MMGSFIRSLLATASLSVLFFVSYAQSPGNVSAKKENKPYRILTSGKKITVKSGKNIQHVMLWTSNGHRVVEQKEINAASFTFTIPINEKIFFLMIGLDGEKIYTEKIGVK
jgi:hypothetical protein